jgi:hypothetical protein
MPKGFKHLKWSIQLLRIAQLRSVVQKFSLPVSGNITHLVSVVLQLVGAMRDAPVLCQINAEVISLLSQQREPFTNPLETMQKLIPVTVAVTINPPPHPLIQYTVGAPAGGPFIAPAQFLSRHSPFPLQTDSSGDTASHLYGRMRSPRSNFNPK